MLEIPQKLTNDYSKKEWSDLPKNERQKIIAYEWSIGTRIAIKKAMLPEELYGKDFNVLILSKYNASEQFCSPGLDVEFLDNLDSVVEIIASPAGKELCMNCESTVQLIEYARQYGMK